MTSQAWVAISVGLVVASIAATAEVLHARRVRRVGRLAFGPEEQPRPWTRLVGPLRTLCLGGFAWALAVLILADTGLFADKPPPVGSGTRHLVFVVDVSPSMYLPDAGAKRDLTRRARLAEVVDGVLERVGGDVTFSVIGFYSNALPVVLQVRDRAVVRNVLDGLPLAYAMGKAQTDLGLSISRAMELIAPFPKASATVFVCTDGDTVALAHPLAAPPSVEKLAVLGVGDRDRGSFIDGHQSRQDAKVLRAVAAALGGEYFDVNDRHVPTTALGGLVQPPAKRGGMSLVQLAILVMTVTAALLAFIPVAQQYAGTGWRVLRPAPPAPPAPARRHPEAA